MHIARAFCLELGKVVDIYEARDHFFRQPQPRRRFRFLCSDPACRETNGTKVTGVNYDKLIEENDFFLRPHYRENTPHIATCEWVEREQASKELRDEAQVEAEMEEETQSTSQSRAKKSSNIVDIFLPCSSLQGNQEVNNISPERLIAIKNIQDRAERIRSYKRLLKDNPSFTNLLENVVSSYELLGKFERATTLLKIGNNPRRPYKYCFRHIEHYTPGRDQHLIHYGGARVKRYPSGYSVRFYDSVKLDDGSWRISLFIKAEQLAKYAHRAYLGELLEELADSFERYATCYFFGQVGRSKEKEGWLEISVNHLDNLVLILKSKQRK